jgi:hypothetical protein
MGHCSTGGGAGRRPHFLQQEDEDGNAHGDLVAMKEGSFLDGNAVHEGAVLAVVVGDAEAIDGKFDGAMVPGDAQIGLRESVIGFPADGEVAG